MRMRSENKTWRTLELSTVRGEEAVEEQRKQWKWGEEGDEEDDEGESKLIIIATRRNKNIGREGGRDDIRVKSTGTSSRSVNNSVSESLPCLYLTGEGRRRRGCLCRCLQASMTDPQQQQGQQEGQKV